MAGFLDQLYEVMLYSNVMVICNFHDFYILGTCLVQIAQQHFILLPNMFTQL